MLTTLIEKKKKLEVVNKINDLTFNCRVKSIGDDLNAIALKLIRVKARLDVKFSLNSIKTFMDVFYASLRNLIT
ncbi:unnamed protein product [Chironomus riparius]|uniref:Uncharacterized protein n=1 Tax=Chironomus riparius TaxID=315576 RepID=A0A9N9RV53_9DIPT|nr:unnamed protein product [Chironomus riparius]